MDAKDIREKIKKARGHLTESTLKSYTYNTLRVHRMAGSFSAKKIEEAFRKENMKPSIARALVNSAIVYKKAMGTKETPDLDKLKSKYDTEFQDGIKLQKRSSKDKERWLTQKEIEGVLRSVKGEIKRLHLHTRENLRAKEKELLQHHFLLEFYKTYPVRNSIATLVVV